MGRDFGVGLKGLGPRPSGGAGGTGDISGHGSPPRGDIRSLAGISASTKPFPGFFPAGSGSGQLSELGPEHEF